MDVLAGGKLQVESSVKDGCPMIKLQRERLTVNL
jgi:hypothetical protein